MHRKPVLWPILALALTACAMAGPNEAPSTLPNPSVVKCREDGWQTEAVYINGVPTDYVCISPDKRHRCEAWKYFRGECPGPDAPPKTEPPR